jgi:hypothetical protein
MSTDIEKRFSDIDEILLKLMEKEPSTFQKIWNWAKPFIIPFILGAIFSGLIQQQIPFTLNTRTTIEQQAATGGAAIPFPSGSPLPSPSAPPPEDWKAGQTAASLTNTSEPPSPPSPLADKGQTKSTRLFRPLFRRMR